MTHNHYPGSQGIEPAKAWAALEFWCVLNRGQALGRKDHARTMDKASAMGKRHMKGFLDHGMFRRNDANEGFNPKFELLVSTIREYWRFENLRTLIYFHCG